MDHHHIWIMSFLASNQHFLKISWKSVSHLESDKQSNASCHISSLVQVIMLKHIENMKIKLVKIYFQYMYVLFIVIYSTSVIFMKKACNDWLLL